MQLTVIHYPGRPWLTLLSGIGALVYYSGLITGVLSLRIVFDDLDQWWITALLLGAGVAGFVWMQLVHRHFERSRGPNHFSVEVDPATYAMLMRIAEESSQKKKESSGDAS